MTFVCINILQRITDQKRGSWGDFPGSPVVKPLYFHCRGRRFDPWSQGTKFPQATWQNNNSLGITHWCCFNSAVPSYLFAELILERRAFLCDWGCLKQLIQINASSSLVTQRSGALIMANECPDFCSVYSPLHLIFIYFIFWPRHTACGILIPPRGIEPATPVVEAQSSKHWTPREFLLHCFKDIFPLSSF